MTKHKHLQSYVIEYLVKTIIIIYLTSVFFFPETLDPNDNLDTKLNFLLILRLILLIALSVVLLAISERIFKVLAFSLLIIGAFFKILMIISQDTFYLHQFLILSDPLMVIGACTYYLYRHKLKANTAYERKKRRSKLKKLEEVAPDID